MRSYAAATWATMEAVHTLMLEVIIILIIIVKIFKIELIILTKMKETTYKQSLKCSGREAREREGEAGPRPLVQLVIFVLLDLDARCSALLLIFV